MSLRYVERRNFFRRLLDWLEKHQKLAVQLSQNLRVSASWVLNLGPLKPLGPSQHYGNEGLKGREGGLIVLPVYREMLFSWINNENFVRKIRVWIQTPNFGIHNYANA